MSPKYERIIKIATQALRLDVLHGHLRWKVTDLSRLTRTSRSQIYLYLGNQKVEILKNALNIFLGELYGTSAERQKFDQSHSQFQGLMRSRAFVVEHPELLAFYFRHRNRKDEIGRIIRNHEHQFLERVAKKNKIHDVDDLLFVRTFIHGVSLAPFLTDADVSRLMRKLSGSIVEWTQQKA